MVERDAQRAKSKGDYDRNRRWQRFAPSSNWLKCQGTVLKLAFVIVAP